MRANYVMHIPVLSTCHLPSSTEPEHSGLVCAEYDIGRFVCTLTEHSPDWFKPIRAWARREHPESNWIRFDADGDTVDLPVYGW